MLQSSSFTFDPNYTLAVLTDATNKHLQLTFALAPVPEPAAALALAVSALVWAGSFAAADVSDFVPYRP